MRTLGFALVALGALAFGCGDNIHAGLSVETMVASNTLAAGDAVGARCMVLAPNGDPALDQHGEPLTDETDLVISYEAPDSFATDSSGQVVAAKVGSASVRCAAPKLGLVDDTPENVQIVAGPPVRVLTRLDHPTTLAGQADGVMCLAFDAFDNPVPNITATLALSPSGAGTSTTATDVTADVAGAYVVTCMVMGATNVTPADLLVLPALPAMLSGVLDPGRALYAILDEVTLIASAFDQFGNRVDDVTYAYSSTPSVASPAPARFRFAQDGTFMLSAAVTSPTQNNVSLSVSLPALVDSIGPVIDCMRIDAPTQAAPAYMLQQAPATVVVPVRIGGAFAAQSVTIGGSAATLNPVTGNYGAAVPLGFGMNFIDVVATDANGVQNSTTCFVLAAQSFTGESSTMADAVALRLDPNAIGDPNPSGLNSLNDLFHTVMSSAQLRNLVDQALVSANPISNGGCGVFACTPRINYNAGSLSWNQPTTSLSLIGGGLHASITLPNVRVTVDACGTTCCIGGSTIAVTADTITATVDFGLQLSGGKIRTAVLGRPQVTVGNVSLSGSGFCGVLVDLLQSFFTGTVRTAVQNALTSFINTNVGPMLDQITSSLDVSTLGTSFAVPRLGGSGSITLLFGLAFSSLDVTPARALIGIGTRFSAATPLVNRPSLGIAGRQSTAMLDPPGTTGTRPVGLSAYEGVLNHALHALWRGGYLQDTLTISGGTATIDSWLPPVAEIDAGNTAQLELGGVDATLTIPGVINNPIHIMFGGHAQASITLVGDSLVFGNLTIDQLEASFDVTLSQAQRTAVNSFLTSALRNLLVNAINQSLPAFPIPTFTLPASVAAYGLPAGAQLGIVNPVLSTASGHAVLDGGFGVR